ncbi:MAG TPA: PilZ domain-containing protein [Spirochaetota bacterium]|nr:PilZ domain-containing protein [Spirochaetota bacterium]
MENKRQYQRKECTVKVRFEYFEGDPSEIDITTSKPFKAKGIILNISRSGIFLVTNSRVSVNIPVRVNLPTRKVKEPVNGIIVRTGLLKNNPTELAKVYAHRRVKGDTYLAIHFDELLDDEIVDTISK